MRCYLWPCSISAPRTVIRAMRPTLPVILITGYSDVDVLKGFNDLRVIVKPFTEDDLVNTISAALG